MVARLTCISSASFWTAASDLLRSLARDVIASFLRPRARRKYGDSGIIEKQTKKSIGRIAHTIQKTM